MRDLLKKNVTFVYLSLEALPFSLSSAETDRHAWQAVCKHGKSLGMLSCEKTFSHCVQLVKLTLFSGSCWGSSFISD